VSNYEFYPTEEYLDWFEQQSLKTKSVISKRIKNITESGHFGDFKNVSKYDKGITKDRIFELRWKDGKRVYYGRLLSKL
jgi:putative component of toxin-antitoxin plasmid stabilization module